MLYRDSKKGRKMDDKNIRRRGRPKKVAKDEVVNNRSVTEKLNQCVENLKVLGDSNEIQVAIKKIEVAINLINQ